MPRIRRYMPERIFQYTVTKILEPLSELGHNPSPGLTLSKHKK